MEAQRGDVSLAIFSCKTYYYAYYTLKEIIIIDYIAMEFTAYAFHEAQFLLCWFMNRRM